MFAAITLVALANARQDGELVARCKTTGRARQCHGSKKDRCQMQMKVVPPVRVLSAPHRITLAEVGKTASAVCAAVEADAAAQGMTVSGPWMFIYRNLPHDPDTPCEIEFCLPVQSVPVYHGRHVLKTLPGATCAAHVHEGPLDRLFDSYATLLRAAAAQGCRLSGESREIYHCWQGPQAAENRVEILFALESEPA
ncbi:GyrI-like domain-containing protein [Ralstonia sp. NFACC01]|jgi:effector-binding domain-containing protein|uniref:GyrI-like domain-containing protein n=1 Tax=Ralstonia sp. NFACC01 TaxID=1566294 RepID=UPI000B817988|nr:GyrI-like domain-containing protein [Ralstonia sp. NFACC01]